MDLRWQRLNRKRWIFKSCANKRFRIQKGNQNGQSRVTGNIGYTMRRKTQHTMRWTPLCVNKHK